MFLFLMGAIAMFFALTVVGLVMDVYAKPEPWGWRDEDVAAMAATISRQSAELDALMYGDQA